MRTAATLAFMVASAGAGLAHAGEPLSADDLTVSGRWGLPTAAGTSLAGRLAVRPAPLPAAVHQALAPPPPARPGRLTPSRAPAESQAQGAWEAAVTRSFTNYGYAAPESSAETAWPVAVMIEGLELSPDDAGLTAVARLTVRPADDTAPACLAHSLEGRFRALRREESGLGQRLFAVVAGVGMAAAGAPGAAGGMMAEQMSAASADNRARNALRPRSLQEAVAPEHGDEALRRFALVNAQRSALAGYLRWLGETRPCEGGPAAAQAQ